MRKKHLKRALAAARSDLAARPIVYVQPDGDALMAELRRRLEEAALPYKESSRQITEFPPCLIVSGPGHWVTTVNGQVARAFNGVMHIVVPESWGTEDEPCRILVASGP